MPPTQRPYHEASQDTFSYKLFPGSFTGHCQLPTLTTKLHRAPLAANSWRVASRDASSCTRRLSPQGSQEGVRWPGKAQGWLCSPPAPRLSLRCNPPSCFVKHEPCPSAPHTGRAPKPVSPHTHLSGRPGSLLTPVRREEGPVRSGAARLVPSARLLPSAPSAPQPARRAPQGLPQRPAAAQRRLPPPSAPQPLRWAPGLPAGSRRAAQQTRSQARPQAASPGPAGRLMLPRSGRAEGLAVPERRACRRLARAPSGRPDWSAPAPRHLLPGEERLRV